MRRLVCFVSCFVVCLASLIITAPGHAASLDYSAFRMLPVLHEGRVKPLDSFARIKLREYADQEYIDGMSPVAWLAETLFDPAAAQKHAVFRIMDADLREQMGLDRARRFFTLTELQDGLEKLRPQVEELLKTPEEKHTPAQQELLKLYDDALDYTFLQRSVSMILPLAPAIPARYQKQVDAYAAGQADYMALMDVQDDITRRLQALIRRKGENPQRYNASEKDLALLGFSLQQLRAAGAGSNHFSMIPPVGASDEWSSPWPALEANKTTVRPVLESWRAMARAWQAGDASAWQKASEATFGQMRGDYAAYYAPELFTLEILYNMLKPFHVALAAYGLVSVLLIIGLYAAWPLLGITSSLLLWLGIGAHTGGMITRIIVLQRPPVGTLYESVLFVSLLCAVLAAVMAARIPRGPHKNIMLLPGVLAAAVLMAVAPVILQRAESMEMLVAVLNTNFWLATHVLCITAGYAVCILCACLAHAYLLLRALGRRTDYLGRAIYMTSLVALLLTSVGTALGGIWADQSWGRFWGWDPKENGALLIVLWLIWLQHGKLSGKLSMIPYVAGMAYLNVIVALAWFGVNLLNVGLHTYGFTSGIAEGLAVFCILETLIIGALWWRAARTPALLPLQPSQHGGSHASPSAG